MSEHKCAHREFWLLNHTVCSTCAIAPEPADQTRAEVVLSQEDLWERFRREGGKIVDAETGAVIAHVDPAKPVGENEFIAQLRVPTPDGER